MTALSGFLAVSIMAALAVPDRAGAAMADDSAVLAARAEVHGADCNLKPNADPGLAIERYKLRYKTLIQVPCRYTINSVESVFFTEDSGGLHPLFFATAGVAYRHDNNGRIDWARARIDGFTAVGELSDASIDTKAGVIHSNIRLAPGEADGAILSVYRLADAALIRVEIDITGKKAPVRIFAWPVKKR